MALSGFDNQKLLLLAGGLDRGNSFDELVLLSWDSKQLFIWRNQKKNWRKAAKKRTLKQFYLLKMFKRRLPLPLIIRKKMILFYYHACASWDQYPNFEVRGEAFMQAVQQLKESEM